MNISFEQANNRTDEWYTPKWLLDILGDFDLDPCAPVHREYDFAKHHYTKLDDGLSKEWFGRVWCNPPYNSKLLSPFMEKMAEHANGIALLFNRMDNSLWHDVIFPYADSIFILKGRLKFCRYGIETNHSAGCGSILIAWDKYNDKILKSLTIKGKYINLKSNQ